MTEEKKEYTPDLTAMFDQFSTTMENFAVLLRIYHKKLLAEGFTYPVANQLVKEFQNTYWNNMLSYGKPK